MTTDAQTGRPADALRGDDETSSAPKKKGGGAVGGVANWMDERTGGAKGIRYLMNKVFPDHWSFMLGEVAMYSLIILLITGTFLTFWYVPSMGETIYHGSYTPLQGQQMSEAYKSTVDISMDIRGGLLIRQIHHWAALLFLVAIMLHMFRVFFTGAFRKPREINWVIGVVLFMLATIEGFAGYSLPDDLLSGTGIRAAQGFMLSIPVIGSYVAYFVFGGAFPGTEIIPRLFTVHVLLLPAIIMGLFAAHMILLIVHKHTQFPGPGRTDNNVVGFKLMPVYTAKAGGFFFIVFGITALISALVTINPIWMYGPYEPTMVTAGAQPDWYMGFADGALRMSPGWWEFTLGGHTYSLNVMIGAILLIPVIFTALGAYPFLEAWVTGDKREHHLLDRPRNAPTRTAIGMGFIAFYFVLFVASGNDIMAITLHLSINDITHVMQASIFILPPLVFWITKRLCMSLQRADRDLVLHGKESGRLVRTAEGRFFEAHTPLSGEDRWRLVSYETHLPIAAPTEADSNGVGRRQIAKDRMRARLSHFYFNDRIEAITPAELAAAHHDGQAHESIEATEGGDRPEIESDEFDHNLHGGAEELSSGHAYSQPQDQEPS